MSQVSEQRGKQYRPYVSTLAGLSFLQACSWSQTCCAMLGIRIGQPSADAGVAALEFIGFRKGQDGQFFLLPNSIAERIASVQKDYLRAPVMCKHCKTESCVVITWRNELGITTCNHFGRHRRVELVEDVEDALPQLRDGH